MIEEFNFISIKEILSRLTRHPYLQDLDLEACIQYTLDFFERVGIPQIYEPRVAWIDIHDYKGELPCDVIRIEQVRDNKTHVILRSMTDTFGGTYDKDRPNLRYLGGSMTFKTQNRTIVTSFKDGCVEVAYVGIKTDENGTPMLPDNIFLQALEAYIKVERFKILCDTEKIKPDTLARAEKDYSWLVGKMINRFKMPSMSEMQTLTNMLHRMIPATHEFETGFKGLGDEELYRKH